MSEQFSTFTSHQVHPSSPVLLTKMAHLELLLKNNVQQRHSWTIPILKFENRSRATHPWVLQSFAFTEYKCTIPAILKETSEDLSEARKHCFVRRDFDLEAFSHNPADVKFATLVFQLAAFTKYLNKVFLSYLLRLLSQNQLCQWSKTNLSHHGLNPTHVPHWRLSNPTLWDCCVSMIGRADIEGSTSNVAMHAWLPQAN